MDYDELSSGLPAPIFYILNDNNEVIPCRDMKLAMLWKSHFPNCRVGLDTIGSYRISTVFLSVPHIGCSFRDNDNYFFETMAFNDSEGKNYKNIQFDPDTDMQKSLKESIGVDLFGNMRRYKTWVEAEKGHNEICRLFESVTGLSRVDQREKEKEKENFHSFHSTSDDISDDET